MQCSVPPELAGALEEFKYGNNHKNNMDQKILILSGLVLVSLIIVLSFTIKIEAGPTGDLITIVGQPVGWTTKLTQPFCEDTDGGLNYEKRGYITTMNHGTASDTCANNRYVLEYYCRDDGNRGRMQKICKYGCEKGECKTSGRTLGISPEGSGYLMKVK